MAKRDTHSSSREPGREHIPIYPRCFTIVRFLQLILGLVLLALSAWGLSLIRWGGTAMLLFTSIATLICSVYILVARFGPAKAHNYWAILALDIMMMIFWLVSFALMAWAAASLFAVAAAINSASNSSYDPYYYYYSAIRDSAASIPTYAKSKSSSSSSSSSSYNSYSNYDSSDYYNAYEDAVLVWAAVAAVCAALGAIQFLLYLISTSIHSCAVRRHRKAGLHCKPGVAATPVAPTNTQPEVGYVPPPQAAPQAMYGQPQYPVDQQQQQMPPMQQQQVYGAPPMMQQQDPNAMYAAGGMPQHQQQGGMVSPVNPQTTGGSYVQGAPVSFDGSHQQHHELQQQPHYTGSSTVGSGPVYETHGESKA